MKKALLIPNNSVSSNFELPIFTPNKRGGQLWHIAENCSTKTHSESMTTVEQATEIILANAPSFGVEQVPLGQAVGRILQQEIYADRDFPPFNRVSMDGISIVFDQFKNGQRAYKIESLQAAGAAQLTLQDNGHCMEVMTGSVLPAGTDTVIRYEDLEISNGVATIQIEDIREGQNVHRQGLDRRAGDLIVPKATRVSPAEIGVAASVGLPFLTVGKMPKLAVASTGDELVDVSEKPLAHQIRKSNVHTLAASVAEWGIPADLLHLPDEKNAIREILGKALLEYDAVLLSGGVSAGKLDFVPEVLEELQVAKLFHKVSQRPGKPFWFGKSGRAAVFAFPGNPVSSFMCLNRYFWPWLRQGLGLEAFKKQYAVLAKDFFFRPDLTYFLQVKITSSDEGKLIASLIEGKGSGDLANLVEADAFLELPKGRNEFKAGEVFPVMLFRS